MTNQIRFCRSRRTPCVNIDSYATFCIAHAFLAFNCAKATEGQGPANRAAVTRIVFGLLAR
jgi:hypothetical protein